MKAFLVTGSDPSLVSRALSDLLAEITGGEAAAAEVEEFEPAESSDEGESRGRLDAGAILAALSTPAWLSDHRVVVVREAGALSAAQASEVSKLLVEPPTDNLLVLTTSGKAVPQVLVKALQKTGGRVVETDPGRGASARNWIDAHLRKVSVHLDAAARHELSDHIGEDAAALDPILELLQAAYGAGAKISPAELEPFLGEEGAAPPWALTDAIDSGDGEEAIRALRRMLGPGGRHPLQILVTLHRHVSAMLRLDGADGVRDADGAAALLGMRSSFPARKALEQGRRLGHDRIVRAIEVLAGADADLRGRVAWPPELVMEVAVARLAQLSRSSARPTAQRNPSGRRR